VRTAFTQRTSAFSPTQTIYSINGDYTMIGNTNMTLQNYSTSGVNSNSTMIKVDADGIASTNNSSSSTLSFSAENQANPSCSRILFAGLYWTARTDGTPTELQKRSVKFRGPGQSNYTSYTASTNDIKYPGDDNMFVGFTEVTSQVQQCGLGDYWLADMALTTGNGGSTGYYGGWGLVVVYENSKMNKRDVTLFDGYAYVVGGTAQWELPVSGFTSALSGSVNTKLGMMAGEGDVTITGDKFEIQKLNSTNWDLLSHGGNSTTNFFNSSIFTGGNTRNPNLANNTGMDISMFNIPNPSNSVIGNGQTSTKFRYSSTQDTYIIYSICMAVDAYEPVVEGFLSTLNVNGIPTTSSNLTVQPGDNIQYKVQIRNKGNEAINNTRIEIPLPYAAIRYQGSSVNVFSPASSSALPYVDATLGANGTLIWDFGTLPLPSNPNTVLGELTFTLKVTEDCELYRNFNCSAPSVQIDGTISGIGANTGITVDDQPFYVGYSNVGGCTTEPLLGPFNIDINSAAWVTANCAVTDGVRDFKYCNRTTVIPVTDVIGFYPNGTRFFNANQTLEYTVSNPFPNQAGPITYRALLPGTSCVLSFTISVTTIASIPTVSSNNIEYCKDAPAIALTATPSNPSFQLFYYAPSSNIAQPLLIPSTADAGNFVYQVAEGPSSTCISIVRKNIPIQVNALPTITASATQIACFGGTGSVELTSNGGTGTLTYNAINPATSGLTAASYTYSVSDSKGCEAIATAVINAAPAQTGQPTLACWESATWNVATCSWDVTGTQTPAPTNLSCWQSATFNTTRCDWDVTGTQEPAPTNLSCWQSATFNTTSCDWDVTGSQEPAPTNLSCWQSATFNTTRCDWDVTGTQEPAPTNLSCWQSATFNTTSCGWDVTGTQAPAPTNLSCYQTATFNTTSCGWDVTGTQAPAPTNLSCWQTATFNTTSCDWDVTGSQEPAPTNLSCWETATFNTTSCDWDVTGTQKPAPTNLSCWETASFNTTSCDWDVTGTQKPAPTNLSCWETATFNTTSCDWDVTGSQEPAPTNLSCWETASFNTTSCGWDVTGTQAPAPTNLSCYQTATFNTTSCAWDVTGTQAQAPTNLSCYQTATFNTTSCAWDVTGTQAPAPTNLSCWQTATFNTTSCAWDVTGTQSPAPTNLSCWQTATFNTTSCAWVVTGIQPQTIVTNASACGSYTWATNNQQYSTSGSYNYSLNCQNYTLNLTINNSSVAASSISTVSTSVNPSATFTLSVVGGSLGTGATWKWYKTSCGGTAIGTGASINVSQTVATTYFVRAEGTCGMTDCKSITINMNCGPTSIASNRVANTVCKGTSITLTVQGTVGTGGSWKWYTGSCGVGAICATGASITVTPTANTTYYVRSMGSTCGTTVCQSIAVIVNSAPATPGTISGSTVGLCGATAAQYSVVPVSGATTYTWTAPTGAVITGGQGTNVITVNFAGASNSSCGTSSTISVKASNSCGTSSTKTLTIGLRPAKATAINGSATACKLSVVTYSVTPIAGATSYTWTVPTGWVIQAGQGTANVTIKTGTCSGSIGVTANSICGNNGSFTKSITLSNCARYAEDNSASEEEITSVDNISVYPNPGFGEYTIVTPSLDETSVVSVYAMDGRLVSTLNVPAQSKTIELHLNDVAKGIYLVRFVSSNLSQDIRVIKQ